MEAREGVYRHETIRITIRGGTGPSERERVRGGETIIE